MDIVRLSHRSPLSVRIVVPSPDWLQSEGGLPLRSSAPRDALCRTFHSFGLPAGGVFLQGLIQETTGMVRMVLKACRLVGRGLLSGHSQPIRVGFCSFVFWAHNKVKLSARIGLHKHFNCPCVSSGHL